MNRINLILYFLLMLGTNVSAQEIDSVIYNNANWPIQENYKGCIFRIYTWDANGNCLTANWESIKTNDSVIHEKCPKANDGQILVAPSSTSSNYSYLWNTNQTSANISNLAPGTYTLKVTDVASGLQCTKSFTVKPQFVDSFVVLKQDGYCDGSDSNKTKVNVTISDTGGVTYTYKWSIITDTTYTAKDSALGFTAGTHNVKIRNSRTGCIKTIPFSINTKPFPAAPSATSNPVCKGDTLKLSASTTSSGVTYGWTGPNSFSSTAQNPIKSLFTVSDTGRYIATFNLNGCAIKDTTVCLLKPGADSVVVSSNTPVCLNSTLQLSATTKSSGVGFSWSGPNTFTATTQNPAITNVTYNAAGSYRLITNLNGCKDTFNTTNVTIDTPHASPIATILVLPNDTICQGTPVTITATVINGGNTPSYLWIYNGLVVPGQITNTLVSSFINNGDSVTCQVTGSVTCQTPNMSLSNTLRMTTIPVLSTMVSIAATPPFFISGMTNTFKATPASGTISDYTYQWRKNGNNIPGETNDTFMTNVFSDGDKISVFVKSKLPCYSPDTAVSNAINVALGIRETQGKSSIVLYPNPNSGSFTLNGTTESKMAEIKVLNMLGQIVHEETFVVTDNTINKTFDLRKLASGGYILHFNGDNENLELSFIVK